MRDSDVDSIKGWLILITAILMTGWVSAVLACLALLYFVISILED